MDNLKIRTVAIVQTRMGSTRLPGKVLIDLEGKPVLWHVVHRLKNAKYIDKIVVATTDLYEDDIIANYCTQNEISYYRGSSDDVLSRYYNAAGEYKAGIIIRITSDCPLIDPLIIDKMLIKFKGNNSKSITLDYMSNTLERTFPRGLDAEIFSFESLERSYREAKHPYEREHVTPYIYQHPELFRLSNYKNEVDYSTHRWTLDTPDDLNLIQAIYKKIENTEKIFLFHDILEIFKNNPRLIDLNKHVEQKKL